jgi:hypothetical protein
MNLNEAEARTNPPKVSPRRRLAPSTPLKLALPCFALACSSLGLDDPPKENKATAAQDAVTYRMPGDALTRRRLSRSADWLEKHLLNLPRRVGDCPVRVIAWKDPTLEPADPKLLAGYVITDTLWSARALKLFDPVASREMEASLQCLGWPGNGLHDVLFHPVEEILHRSADEDLVHGFSLGRFPTGDGRVVDLRVFRQKWDAEFDAGHPVLLAEHALYSALFDFWQNRVAEAHRRVLDTLEDQRATHPRDRVFWDDRNGILVDHVTYKDWLAFQDGKRPVCRHFTFKLGVLLYTVRLLGMEKEVGARLNGMKRRLWSAQTESGGLAHFVDVRGDGKVTTGRHPTGEASAIAVLSEVVEPRQP